jgi:hypothetical protein
MRFSQRRDAVTSSIANEAGLIEILSHGQQGGGSAVAVAAQDARALFAAKIFPISNETLAAVG